MKAPAFWSQQPGMIASLLSPLGWLYGQVTLRRMAHPGVTADIPVICIGNFTLGGAGKTPTAIALARALIAAGERPVFITRGYGGREAGPLIVSETSTPDLVGDEPLLLARVAPSIVARDRAAGLPQALGADATVIILDDGMQNPALAKTFVLAVVDGTAGFGNNLPFPAGPLRAPANAQAAFVDAVLVIGEGRGDADARMLGKPVHISSLRADAGELPGTQVFAFAGIGRPEKFFDTLREIGCSLAGTVAFPDHHRFTDAEAYDLLTRASAAGGRLVTTEKDYVRLTGSPALETLAAATQPLPVSLALPERLLKAIKGAIGGFRARA